MPQKPVIAGSTLSGKPQLAESDEAWNRRFVSPQLTPETKGGLLAALQAVSQVYTVIVETDPPLLKSLISRRSPARWNSVPPELVNPSPPPTALLPRPILFWKNQKP